MQSPKNEKGYALVIVLLVIVFIMILSAVFMRGSISNAKQQHIVDDNNLAYTAAEMGVDYYKWLYINKFKAERDKIWNDMKLAYESDKVIINKKSITNEKKEEELKQAAKNRQNQMVDQLLNLHFNNLEKTKPDTTDSLNYSILEPIKYSRLTDTENRDVGLIVKGKVLGEYGKGSKRAKNLDFELMFDFPLLVREGISNPPNNGENSLAIPVVNIKSLIENNKQTKPCTTNPYNEKCLGQKSNDTHFTAISSIVYFPVGYTKGNGNIGIDFKNTQIYSNANIELPNMNNMNNITMYADGNIELKNLNGANQANLYTTGNIEFKNASSVYSNSILYAEKGIDGKNTEFKKMKIFVGGNYTGEKFALTNNSIMIVDNELKIEKAGSIQNSNLVVKGNIVIEKSLIIKDNSKVCVGGNIDFNKINLKTIDSNSKIYFVEEKAKPRNVIGQYPNLIPMKESVFQNNPKALYDNCIGGGNGSEGPDISDKPNWVPPKIDVTYN
ncbi:hypothetical protein CSV71_03920 [Sporosarcina sp. P21c]|uniref:hypothetical protein n=1 Tax=unclassified Sporosarcina TaxID=2647733 RepID=UPI000C16F137|nr:MULTISPECIES: hypothetical protein [unclassified Sporosarcina]PIC67866.1 hypothetical protein CSV78_06010 [Sporosarcina sp. P16a]PIC90725.1 hypothetical protein CSV71_03920 [Sporosarcina sp. P21c]PIC93490.1 hypothetical protein CSV70_05875 [Sporosarcina sp. P25]